MHALYACTYGTYESSMKIPGICVRLNAYCSYWRETIYLVCGGRFAVCIYHGCWRCACVAVLDFTNRRCRFPYLVLATWSNLTPLVESVLRRTPSGKLAAKWVRYRQCLMSSFLPRTNSILQYRYAPARLASL